MFCDVQWTLCIISVSFQYAWMIHNLRRKKVRILFSIGELNFSSTSAISSAHYCIRESTSTCDNLQKFFDHLSLFRFRVFFGLNKIVIPFKIHVQIYTHQKNIAVKIYCFSHFSSFSISFDQKLQKLIHFLGASTENCIGTVLHRKCISKSKYFFFRIKENILWRKLAIYVVKIVC